MTSRKKNLAAIASIVALGAAPVGIALATASPTVTPAAHVMGANLAEEVKMHADGIKFKTKGPTAVSVLTLTVDPGATTGWHSHPGLAIIAVSEGTGTLRFADCSERTYSAGSAFVETGDDRPTEFVNETSSPVVLTVTFLAPRGANIIREEIGPSCG